MPDTSYIEAVYSKYSRFYDAIFSPFFNQGQRLAVRLLNIAPDDRVLEVGIGTGALLPFYPRDVKLVGIDISEAMLARAKALKDRIGMPNVRLMRMDATQLDFPDGSFDKVIAAYVITVVPDPIRVVEEMKRVCKKGGVLLFLNHFKSERFPLRQIEELISPLCEKIGFCTNLELDYLLRRTNLRPNLVRRVNLFGLWKIVRCTNE